MKGAVTLRVLLFVKLFLFWAVNKGFDIQTPLKLAIGQLIFLTDVKISTLTWGKKILDLKFYKTQKAPQLS